MEQYQKDVTYLVMIDRIEFIESSLIMVLFFNVKLKCYGAIPKSHWTEHIGLLSENGWK